MNIVDLAILKKMIGGGGGSGTDNYNDLSNLPQINGETLAGNKTAENLGLQEALTFDSTPTEGSTNPVESGGVYTALSGKQDAISDLEAIKSGAAAGASAVQPSEMQTALAGKQNSLDQTQLAAVNSGITSEKVGQISTNQNDILTLAKHNGIINLLNFNNANVSNARGVTYDIKGDGSVIVNGTPTAGGPSYVVLYLGNDEVHVDDYCDGNHVLYGCPSGGSESTYCMYVAKGSYVNYDTGSGTILWSTAQTSILVVIRISDGYTANNLVFKPAIIDKALWDSGFTTPIVKTLPNFTLTPALIEQVNSGAKNIAEIYNVTQNAITITTSGYKATFSGSASQDGSIYWGRFHADKTGDYILYFNMSTSAGRFTVYNETDREIIKSCYPTDNLTPIAINLVAGKSYSIYSWFAAGTASACVIDLMICTKAAFIVSQKYVPYQPDPYEKVTQNISNSTTMYAKRAGRVVTINGYMDNISFTANTGVTIGTIDDSIGKPPQQVRAVCNVGSNAYSVGKQGYVTIQTDGNIRVTSEYSGTGAVYFSVSYVL